ncbi:ABC transporter permease [Clostridium baratii]|uniref:ABC transporter permease n=1 Tax=Clostridium baratii TaxID=1561 RepID=UPI0029153AF8|nr:ABC transporter permease [Clostridium baratii]MDU4912110.1 ABC transporter permease [Clostridium baratii]
MSNLVFVLKEHKENWYRIRRLAVYDFIAPLRDTYLGMIWIVLNPLLQISVYWIVFGMGIRNGRPVDGHPFLLWMLAGLIPWFYIGSAISGGALCIYNKSQMLTKMKFPSSIIPTYTTLTKLIETIPTIGILFIVYAFYGYKINLYSIQIIYYFFSVTILIIGLSLLNSALVMAIRDINRIITTIVRFLFYLTPILWVPSKGTSFINVIIKLNPFTYIIDGIRESLLYNKSFIENINGTIYFWGFTIIIFLLGITVHMKLRNKFADMI